MLVGKSVEVTVGAGAGVGGGRVGRRATTGAGQTRGAAGGDTHAAAAVGVGGVGQRLQSRLLSGLLGASSRSQQFSS